MKKLGIAGLAVAGLMVTSTVASAQLCAIGLIIAAGITSATENRELTAKEAMFCGLTHETPAKETKKKKVAGRAKKQ
jgi:hypothetical protein